LEFVSIRQIVESLAKAVLGCLCIKNVNLKFMFGILVARFQLKRKEMNERKLTSDRIRNLRGRFAQGTQDP
jgi:hypothetical protein